LQTFRGWTHPRLRGTLVLTTVIHARCCGSHWHLPTSTKRVPWNRKSGGKVVVRTHVKPPDPKLSSVVPRVLPRPELHVRPQSCKMMTWEDQVEVESQEYVGDTDSENDSREENYDDESYGERWEDDDGGYEDFEEDVDAEPDLEADEKYCDDHCSEENEDDEPDLFI